MSGFSDIGAAGVAGISGDRTVVIRLALAADSFITGLGAAGASTAAFSRELQTATAAGKKGTADISRGAMLTGAAMLGMAGFAVKAFADFDASMSRVKANSNATGAEFDQLKASAIDLGNKTKFSATEAADAQNELAKAGMHTGEIIRALPGVLALAAAGELGLAEAASITTATLAQFGLGAAQAGHVADVLAAGADRSLADVAGLGEALKYVAPAAHMMKISLEETVGTLALFAQNGLQGSIAGTTLADVITRVGGRSKKASKEMDELGMHFFDATGKFIGIAASAQVLHDKLAGLGDDERIRILKDIFGMEGLKGAIALFNAGGAVVDKWTASVNAAGFAAANAHTKTDNLKGDFEKLTSAIQGGFIQAGSGANGVLRSLTQGATGLATAFTDLPQGLQTTATLVGGVSGLALVAAGTFGTLAPKIRESRTALEGMGKGGQIASSALGKIGAAAGIAGAALVAFQLVGAALPDTFSLTATGMERLTNAVAAFGRSGQIGGKGLDVLGGNLKEFALDVQTLDKSGIHSFEIGYSKFMESLIGGKGAVADASARLQSLDTALAALAANGHADEAAVAYKRLADAAAMKGVSPAELAKGFTQYNDVVAAAAEAAGRGAAGQKDLQAQLAAVSKSAKEAQAAVKGYTDALKGMTPEGQLIQDTIAMNKALGDARTAFRQAGNAALDHSGNLDLTKKSGQDAMETLIGVSQAVRSVAADMRAAGDSEEAANAKLMQGRATFLKLAAAAGLGSAKANDLADALGLIPPHTAAAVTTPGAKPSVDTVTTLNARIRALQGKIVRVQESGAAGSAARVAALAAQINSLRSRRLDIVYNVTRIGAGPMANKPIPNADGGVYVKAASGYLPKQAAIAGRGSGTMYQWNEPETGGEAFIPLGASKRSRSKALAEDVVNRFGGTVAWTGGGMAASSPSTTAAGGTVTAVLSPTDRALLQAVANRPVDVDARLIVDSEVVARANNKGQRIVRQKG